MPDVRQRARIPWHGRPWLPSVLALALCALLVANWLSPVGFRLNQRSLDALVLFGTLSLLSACAFTSGRRMRTTWQRLLVRSLGAMVCLLAVPAGCISFVFRVDALPVAEIVVRSDRVVAYWMVGGAVGPHYTEFREERSVLPGVLLARVVGYSPDIGSVTLSVTSGSTLRAVIADDAEVGTQHLFECPVAPLLPW
jgi:hypothetical protein